MCAADSGDREKALGLTVSPVCDRQTDTVADIQIGQLHLCFTRVIHFLGRLRHKFSFSIFLVPPTTQNA